MSQGKSLCARIQSARLVTVSYIWTFSLLKDLYAPNAVYNPLEISTTTELYSFITWTSLGSTIKMTEVGQKIDTAGFEVGI